MRTWKDSAAVAPGPRLATVQTTAFWAWPERAPEVAGGTGLTLPTRNVVPGGIASVTRTFVSVTVVLLLVTFRV